MGPTFNRLFLIYLIQFACAFFAFTLSLCNLLSKKSFKSSFYRKKLTGTAVFLILGGVSVLQ